jgi:hypothetical protein
MIARRSMYRGEVQGTLKSLIKTPAVASLCIVEFFPTILILHRHDEIFHDVIFALRHVLLIRVKGVKP